MTTARLTFAAAVLAGLCAALGQAPWGLWSLTLAGLAWGLILGATAPGPRAAFVRLWLAGSAYFALTLVWIVEPFLIEPDRHGWMAPFALIFLATGLALFWGLAGAAGAYLGTRAGGRLVTIALSFVAFEGVRGHLFTGFPWAMVGHAWIDTPVAQVAAIGGGMGLSGLTLSWAAALAAAWLGLRRGNRLRAGLIAAVAAATLAATWAGGAWRLSQPAPVAREITLRLVQPNAAQDLKWHPDHAEGFFARHLDLTAAGPTPDLVLWSETAVPFYLDNPGDGLAMAARAAGGAPILMGIQRRDWAEGGPRWFNSLALIGPDGTAEAVYDKHHLVPFGEYVPILGAWAAQRGLRGLAQVSLLGYTPGPGPMLMDLGRAGRVLPLICYEAVFPRNLRGTERPDWIFQATNDAWFGAHVGPFQHLAQARLRAIEAGLPLVRVANTGVSAVIDARGQIVDALGMNVARALDAQLPGALAPTPWARLGDWPLYLALALALAGLLARRARLSR